MVSVNLYSLVEGDSPSRATVDGIEFASENQFCQIHVLCNAVVVCCFVFLLPRTPNFNVGNVLWHLRTRFHYTQPHFRPPTRILPNIEIGGRGGVTNQMQRCHGFHLRTRFHLLTKSQQNLSKYKQ